MAERRRRREEVRGTGSKTEDRILVSFEETRTRAMGNRQISTFRRVFTVRSRVWTPPTERKLLRLLRKIMLNKFTGALCVWSRALQPHRTKPQDRRRGGGGVGVRVR